MVRHVGSMLGLKGFRVVGRVCVGCGTPGLQLQWLRMIVGVLEVATWDIGV